MASRTSAVLYLAKGKNFQANHNIGLGKSAEEEAVLYLAKGKNFQANHNVVLIYSASSSLCFT